MFRNIRYMQEKKEERKGEKKRDKEGKTRQNRTTVVSLLSN